MEARNQADQLCYQLEKMIKENDEKLSDSDKEPLEQAIERTRAVAKEDDTQAIRTAVSELEQVSQAFSKTLYENSAAAGDGAGSGEASEEDAIDAEFEVSQDDDESEE